MAQLDSKKFSSSSKTSQNTPRTAKSQNSSGSATFRTPRSTASPTFQQLLQAGDATLWPSSPFAKHNDYDGGHSPTKKLTVISKVKEKARKWRRSLSVRRRQSQSTNLHNTRSWGASTDDHEDEGEEEDPEYLGAPMYESELAPENYKQAAKQKPRAVPMASEKHVLESSVRNNDKNQEAGTSSSKTMTESVTEKLAPAYGAVSDATQTIASKIADSVGISGPTDTSKDGNDGTDKAESSMEGRVHGQSNSPGKSKGVSVTEYLMKKLEPGEAEKALSQVITEKITPSRSPGGDQAGMVERLKGAVTSFLITEPTEPSSDLEIRKNLPPVNAPNSSTNATSSSEASTSISPKKTPSPRKLVYKPQNPSSPHYNGNSSSHTSKSNTKEKTSHDNPSSAPKNAVPHEDTIKRIPQSN
ncbi:low-temperature-induced 65 kDa protein isoform X1 [Daucus carota subsp. sativus]|uniref:low-temperature-induced 65 kDa protein isoform X1 n=1 Tax=Daucus carota subsp. sativus TaxID=79200 RepID=UPI0007EF175A|nr:PREDICTED: low-temperature-induced 65 kDa protein-like isoform X1 [Daucus carota subsp. sativus]